MSSKEEQKEILLNECLLILNSAQFIETKLYQAYGELEEAQNNNFFENIPKIKSNIEFLFRQADKENQYMDEFTLKNKEIINEEKSLLRGLEQEKSLSNGSLSKNTHRPTGCFAV